MSVKMRTLTLFAAFAAVLLLAVSLSTCDSPLGFGNPIDWEPPRLWFDPEPQPPLHVRGGAILEGYVTDNIGVDRVIVRNAKTGEEMELFEVTLSGDRWQVVMNFTEADNNTQVPIEIVAYDRAGNSDDRSMVAITIIIDTGPPIVEDIWIQRTDIKRADLEPYSTLLALETTDDPLGEKSDYVNRYQNGFFTIEGKVAETETRIDIVSLNIYDKRDLSTPLLELVHITEQESADFSPYKPRWLVSEEALLDAGEASGKWPNYKSDYYNTNVRYYYQVVIVAYDRSNNESGDETNKVKKEEEGWFVMWQNADIPKDTLDPNDPVTKTRNPIFVQKGGSLPVVFFDDDQLLWAYAGLLTLEQWEGTANIASGNITIPQYTEETDSKARDQKKLTWLRNRLRGENGVAQGDVYNWRYDRYTSEYDNLATLPANERAKLIILDEIDGKPLDEKFVYVQAGNEADDNGQYVLFTLAADVKLAPHTGTGPQITNMTREKLSVERVDVIDENEPLIVFDTVDTSEENYREDLHFGSPYNEPIKAAQTGNSPEENTFPKLEADGEHFSLNGYTLRVNRGEQDIRVKNFRMAWIPMDMITSAPSGKTEGAIIKEVQDALQSIGYPSSGYNKPDGTTVPSMNSLEEEFGVKHWDFIPGDLVSDTDDYIEGTLLNGTDQVLDEVIGSYYKKQVFKKRFNVLKDFINKKGELENSTKLFVFYAEDTGHVVFRTLRLLGKRTPPELAIYDISSRVSDTSMPGNPAIPDISVSPYLGNAENQQYIDALKTYNVRGDVYALLKDSTLSPPLSEDDKTIPFQIYTRDTILKYWVTANKSGDLNIASITMQDITVEAASGTAARKVGNDSYPTDGLTYVELFPDESQRVFLFTVRDTLGNEATAQRTVAITNTARLESITTTSGNGTYGIGNEIMLDANFSGQIRIEGTPELNVRYQFNGNDVSSLAGRTYTRTGNYIYESIKCEPVTAGTSVLSLHFRFTVPENAFGQLITMYDGDNLGGVFEPNPNNPVHTERPVRLLTNAGVDARIIDFIRNQDAFVPGYKTGSSSMPKWTTSKGSLQASKTITLDGARPAINRIDVSGKTAYSTGVYYFKTDETILLTLTTTGGKNIRASTGTAPRLQYFIRDPQANTISGPHSAAFTYLRPLGSQALVFSLEVNAGNCPADGELIDVSLVDAATVTTIEDEVGNGVTAASVSNLFTLTKNFNNIYIKKSVPAAPVSTLTNTAFAGAATLWNVSPQLRIPESAAVVWGGQNIENVRQYSLDGGLNWVTFPTARDGWTTVAGTAPNQYLNVLNGTWNVTTRYVDRAGNEGAQTSKPIQVNMAFPRLLGITSTKPNGTYNIGNSLSFNLDFADTVVINNNANISLTLQDTTSTTNNPDGGINPSYQIILSGANVSLATNGKTVTFTWSSVNGKDMLAGLRVTDLNLSGLRDEFGNSGPANATTYSSTNVRMPASGGQAAYDVAYNLTGVIVSGITPVARTYTPVNAANLGNNKTTAVSSDNKTITITFSKPMQRGNGTITIRPHGNYAIPAVFENEGYYLAFTYNNTNGTQTETRSSSKPTTGDSTYVSGMNDVFNNMTAAQRNYLITGGTLAAPDLNASTGLSTGPYKKMTHGLKQGAGYTGNYNNNMTALPTPNAPGTEGGTTYMVPDITTKWVLAYNYQIHDATANSAVSNIRAALTDVGFRRQQIAVTSTANVAISGSTVTITLPEPLLPGLQWDLSYGAGTFTDLAGNPAAAVADTTHWFWSRGVQTPVIRVDRKSYDGRAAATGTSFIHDGSNTTQTYSDTNAYSGTIASFNTVAYRIETETPGGRIFYGTRLGSDVAGGSITGAWTGRATLTTGTNLTTTANLGWAGDTTVTAVSAARKTANETVGTWVRTNLIFRNYNGNSVSNPQTGTYTVTENGITVTQVVGGPRAADGTAVAANTTGAFANNYYGFRSFNRDALVTELSGLGLAATTSETINMYTNSFGYDALQASKNYVAANAQIDHVNANFNSATYTSPRGYEGVFRTVIALNQAAATGNTGNSNANYILLCGTNVKSGIPTVAGFPAKDGVANTDTRYLKVFHMLDGDGDNNRRQYYWVSTEIVTSWYMQSYRRGNDGGSYLRVGDATDWMTAGYGDLSYAFNVYSW